jgi:hypothetical protein
VTREEAYAAIAAIYAAWGYDNLGWTPALVAETEQRLAVDDADVWDSSVHFADFALQVLDRLGVVEPYDGPGDLRPRPS